MSSLGFKKATKSQSRLRLGLVGVSGSGKTFSALSIAKGLGKRIALIDTERGSASKYAGDVADFDVLELDSYAPAMFVQAIRAADAEGYDVLIIDSLSHAWMGKDGALEMVDRASKRSQAGNSFAAWREVTPEHNALVEAILQARAHVIVTMRAKTEYVLEENERGKKTPRKIGLAPVQRDGLEYEFDVVADLDHEHNMVVTKTRCAALDRAVMRNPGEDVAKILLGWLTDGEKREAPSVALLAKLREVSSEAEFARLRDEARAVWGKLAPVEREAVTREVDAAKARFVQREQDRLEAEQAEAALRAQELAEQGEGARA